MSFESWYIKTVNEIQESYKKEEEKNNDRIIIQQYSTDHNSCFIKSSAGCYFFEVAFVYDVHLFSTYVVLDLSTVTYQDSRLINQDEFEIICSDRLSTARLLVKLSRHTFVGSHASYIYDIIDVIEVLEK